MVEKGLRIHIKMIFSVPKLIIILFFCEAKSGHPGAPMGCAPIAHLLYSGENSMKYSPSNPAWANRDR